ncbi:hypothetical protein ACPOL_2327 [Acidisarcina polymorpha]|uniref:Lipoprotein n=2 Tax=Acidisarcina polymorpha TaxID=2211140 RepID=A0A2Z5FXR2_9BACT|nr:hypothetical protein ACPOL_2327 [Acidisarcina polymorpha]
MVGVPGILAFSIFALLAGCSSFKKPNEKNFMVALNAYYSHHDECLFTNTLSFPYETARNDQSGAGAKGMDALTASDLMKRQEAKQIGVNRYTLTPAGERAGGRFCYGHREITGVPGFTPPVVVNGLPTTTVTYRYTLHDVPVWANTDAMRAAFPALAKSVSANPEDTAKLELTINGWELASGK